MLVLWGLIHTQHWFLTWELMLALRGLIHTAQIANVRAHVGAVRTDSHSADSWRESPSMLVLWGLIHTVQIPDVGAHVGAMRTDPHSVDSWCESPCWCYEYWSTQRRFLMCEPMLALWELIHTAQIPDVRAHVGAMRTDPHTAQIPDVGAHVGAMRDPHSTDSWHESPCWCYEDWSAQHRFLTWELILALWGEIHIAQISNVRAHVGAMRTDSHSADSWRESSCWRYEDWSTQRRFLTWELMLVLWGLIHTQHWFLTWELMLALRGLIHTAQISDVKAHVGAMRTYPHSADSWHGCSCWRYEDLKYESTDKDFRYLENTVEVGLAEWNMKVQTRISGTLRYCWSLLGQLTSLVDRIKYESTGKDLRNPLCRQHQTFFCKNVWMCTWKKKARKRSFVTELQVLR